MNPYMKAAIEEAEQGINNNEGGPFGCIIVKDGAIIGRGHNQVVLKKDPTCHGEMMAIRDACRNLDTFDLSGCELYTTGQPCPMCWGAILWANIAKIFYGCNVSDTDRIGFRDQKFFTLSEEETSGMMQEIDREECLKLYGRYRRLEKRTHY
jgi:guanine deaminase